jgi:transposase
MILLLADGISITDIAATIGTTRNFVYKWARRFLEQRVEGLIDKPGRDSRRWLRQGALQEQHDMAQYFA